MQKVFVPRRQDTLNAGVESIGWIRGNMVISSKSYDDVGTVLKEIVKRLHRTPSAFSESNISESNAAGEIVTPEAIDGWVI
jgi:hypothetical protein